MTTVIYFCVVVSMMSTKKIIAVVAIVAGILLTGYLFKASRNKNPYANRFGIREAIVAQIDTANYTSIEWVDSLQNFGTIQQGDSVQLKYSFRNSGNKPLYLIEAHSSCGCTVADYPKDLILPGQEGILIAKFDSRNKLGYIHKTILVTTNTTNKQRHLLILNGQVKDSAK